LPSGADRPRARHRRDRDRAQHRSAAVSRARNGGDARAWPDTVYLSPGRDAGRTLAAEDGTIVLRHLEHLSQPALRLLGAALEQAAARGGARIVMTATEGTRTGELAGLLRLFPTSVRVPPLRHHVENVQSLVPFLLQRVGFRGRPTCSHEAMQVLLRAHWPGNVQQVLDVLHHVVRSKRTGVITPSDLPPEIASLTRRRLSLLESMERDAIVLALQDANGNKAEAARGLGDVPGHDLPEDARLGGPRSGVSLPPTVRPLTGG